MGRFSLSSSPETHEDEDEHQLAPFVPAANTDLVVEPCTPSLNPIYIHHNHYPLPQKKHGRISLWWIALGAVILAHIISRYGPPAPPPSTSAIHSLGWQEFFLQEGTRLCKSLITLGSVIPHVWHWCIHGIRQEMEQVVDEWTRFAPCPIVMSSKDWHSSIVGQSRAVSIVADALDAWNQQSPLFLLLTGTVGTGKLRLARQIAQHVFGEDCTHAVLLVDAQQDDGDLLSHEIMRHVSRQGGNGAVVIIRHLEALSTRQVVHLFKQSSHYEKLIFVGIAGIGTKSIHQYLKLYRNMERIPKMELEMDIRDEVDENFDEPVEKYIHAIAPFAPIGQAELREILQLNVENISRQQEGTRWKSLVMTDELAAALVSPIHVEYIEWKDKTSGETILVFSATGADVLENGSPIMNKVTAQIKQCLTDVAPDRDGKLDYDKSIQQGVVSWCVGTSCFETCRFSLD